MRMVAARVLRHPSRSTGRIRWRDVLKEPKHTSLEICAQQIEQCITIALECLNYDPTRRPTGCDISQMLTGELCSCQKKTLLSTQPYLLRFHFTRNYEVTSCPLQLTNNTDDTVAFRIVTSDREKHFPWPVHGLVLPRSMSTLRVALYRPLEGDTHFCMKLESTITDEQYHLPDVQGSSSYEYNCLFTEAKNKGREVQQVKLSFVIAHEVLERDNVMKKFQDVIDQLELALCAFPYSESVISDEVREQVELLHAQLRRAKEHVDMPDDEFLNDLLSLFNKSCDHSAEPAILERLSEKLHMMTMVSSGGDQDPEKHIDKMSRLLKKIKDFVQTQNADLATPIGLNLMDSNRDPRPVTIPDEFRCPISLELMKDPVIVATGQTYERVCIEKWLASGRHNCPTTQQRMSDTALIPNYVLRSLIAQWCKANKIEPQNLSSQPNKPTSACTSRERANIDAFVSKLCSPDLKEQRSAAAELCLLAKESIEDRIYIGEAGAIPLLLILLSSSDVWTREHAVTALLNLSIHEDNKIRIISAGALPSIIRVLENGSIEARENAAATLFSLSVIDEYKVTIGESGAIPALVVLLSEGSLRGKKDAAVALFNLCTYQGNKGRAVRTGLVTVLMGLVTDPTGALVDEASGILFALSIHPEGKAAIGAAEPVPILVGMIKSGTPRIRENAAGVMLQLCSSDKPLVHLAHANECGIMVPLRELAENGTDRGKRRAGQLLEQMRRFLTLQASAEVFDQVSEGIADIPEQSDSHSPLFP